MASHPHPPEVAHVLDAYTQITPAKGRKSGWGTAWVNQIISKRDGVVVSNMSTGWMMVYGLAGNTRYTVTFVKGKCGSNGESVTTSRRITTDSRDGWRGKYQVSAGTSRTWFVRGGYRVDIAEVGGSVKACGLLSDDPDVGN